MEISFKPRKTVLYAGYIY